MPETDLALLRRAATDAGEIALGYWRNEPEIWTKPDASPVSSADLAVDTALRERLSAARPEYGWISEESEDDLDRLSRETVFIVDPIDGTRAYLDGAAEWALSLAVARAGEVTAAVVHLPARGLTYGAAKGQGATLNDVPIAASRVTRPEGATMLASRPTYAAAHWQGEVPRFKRQFRSSMAWRLALVAEARFDAMMTLKPAWEWDIAAGSLIAAEAGARVTDRRGAALRFNSTARRTDGILAAPGRLHGAILSALA